MADGLPQNSVYSITQADDGYIWLATEMGLVKFDGIKFRTFNSYNSSAFSNNTVVNLYNDKKGTIWIALKDGTILTLKKGKILHYSKIGDSSKLVKLHIDDSGTIWAGTSKGLVTIENRSVKHFSAKDGFSGGKVSAFSKNRDGSIWIGSGNGLFLHKDGKLKQFTKDDGLSDDRILSLHKSSDGTLFIGTFGGGLNIFKDGKFTLFDNNSSLLSNFIISVYEDSKKNIWIATKNGLNRLENGNLTKFTAKDGLSGSYVYSIYEDREKNLWFGTVTSGINLFSKGKFKSFSKESGLSAEIIFALKEDLDGNILIGSHNGNVDILRSDKISSFTKIPSDKGVTSFIFGKQGELLLGTYGKGVLKKEDDSLKLFREKDELSSYIRSMLQDSGGTLWIGTEKGVFRIVDDKSEFFHVGTSVREIFETSEHEILIGTFKGVLSFKDGEFKPIYNKKDEITSQVHTIVEDSEKNLWIGTYGGGLYLIKGGKPVGFSIDEGMVGDTIFSIVEDDSGHLWFSSFSGISKVAKKDFLDFISGKIKRVNPTTYDESDGMKSREAMGITPYSGIRSKSGKLYFAMVKGVVEVDPANIEINKTVPPVHIEKFSADKKLIDFSKTAILSPGIKDLEIEYTALSFISPGKVKFKYMMEGYDKTWIDAGSRRTAYYTNLSPGDYIFRVIACNNDGIWNKTGTSFSFSKRPYFYQTTWFYLISAALFLTLTYLFYRIKTKEIIEKNEELEEIAEESSDEIVSLKEELREKYSKNKISEDYAAKTLKKLKQLMENEELYKIPSIGLKDISEKLEISPHNLSQLLNTYLSQSFYNYINAMRIEDVKKMLLSPDHKDDTVFIIAMEAGFKSKSSFNQMFKKSTGVTPTQYRKRGTDT